jgi:hypothetical protein
MTNKQKDKTKTINKITIILNQMLDKLDTSNDEFATLFGDKETLLGVLQKIVNIYSKLIDMELEITKLYVKDGNNKKESNIENIDWLIVKNYVNKVESAND